MPTDKLPALAAPGGPSPATTSEPYAPDDLGASNAVADDLPPDAPGAIARTRLDVRTLSLAVIAGIGALLFLRFARSVFIPLTIGVLISYALEPIVAWLRKWSIPRAVGAAVALAFIVWAAGFGLFMLIDDAVAVVDKLPAAAKKFRALVEKGDEEEGLMEKVQEAATEIENTTTQAVGPDQVRDGVTRVQLEEKPINVRDYLWRGGTGATSVASDVVMVIFLVYFMLVTADLFKQKITRVLGASGLRKGTSSRILDDIGAQISRYMLIQMTTSLVVGVASGIAFWWVGLEHATIWGIVVGLLDMIPYFGPVVATMGLFMIGFLQFGTVTMGLLLAGLTSLFMSLEGLILTPWLTMRTLRINGVALFLGLMFWGWMWGFWGLLLAVPMMVMIKSFSDHVEGLKPIGELLGT